MNHIVNNLTQDPQQLRKRLTKSKQQQNFQQEAKLSTIKQVVEQLLQANNIVFFTGAGISAASGVPTFRGKDGFWTSKDNQKYKSEKILTKKAFNETPELVWAWHRDFRNILKNKFPNESHFLISQLHQFIKHNKELNKTINIVTQNIDGFHPFTMPYPQERLGFHEFIYEIHGNINYMRCDNCPTQLFITPNLNQVALPVCPRCQNIAQYQLPHVLFFDEAYNETYFRMETVMKIVKESDCIVVIGTKLQTSLAQQIVKEGVETNKVIIELNPNPQIDLGNIYTIKMNAEQCVPQLCKQLLIGLQKQLKKNESITQKDNN